VPANKTQDTQDRKMRIVAKSLHQETVAVDLDPICSCVSDLKQALCASEPSWSPPSSLKVVCNGAPLADDGGLREVAAFLSANPARFVVVVRQSVKAKVSSPPNVAPAAAPAPTVQSRDDQGTEEVDDVVGLGQLLEMGFDRFLAERALAASGGDVALAVDGLMTGRADSGGGRRARSGSGSGSSSGGAPSSSSLIGGESAFRRLGLVARSARAAELAQDLASNQRQLAMLRRMPEVQSLLRMPRLAGIEKDPALLQKVLRRVLLSEELQEAMKRGTVTEAMLDDALREEDKNAVSSNRAGAQQEEGLSRIGRFQRLAHRRREQQLQQQSGGGMAALEARLAGAEEEAAVARLQELGFERAMALEAYFACERDEALAASLLFQQQDH
jgi:hypothetical protein